MPRLLIALLLCAGALLPRYAAADTDTPTAADSGGGNAGDVTVIDGDTLEVDGEIVRLHGIDAPELGQFCLNGTTRYRCGYEAALNLSKLVRDGPLECHATTVAGSAEGLICSVGEVDPAESMLRQGYAVATASALPVYRRAESEAKRSKLGIWRGDFIPPAEWRAGARLANGDGPKQACDIKGIVSDTGEQVYLLPADPEYQGIELEESRGERLFCSDDQAELAGWRRWPRSAARRRSATGNDRTQ